MVSPTISREPAHGVPQSTDQETLVRVFPPSAVTMLREKRRRPATREVWSRRPGLNGRPAVYEVRPKPARRDPGASMLRHRRAIRVLTVTVDHAGLGCSGSRVVAGWKERIIRNTPEGAGSNQGGYLRFRETLTPQNARRIHRFGRLLPRRYRARPQLTGARVCGPTAARSGAWRWNF
jgi:hypothetical protein